MLDRKIEPVIKDAVEFEFNLKPFEHHVLDNGVEVYAIDAGAQDVVAIDLVFYSGNAYETQNIVAASTNFLLKNGTASKNAFEINEHFDYYGASLSRACYSETATVSLHSLSRHLPALLPLMSSLITDAVFPQTELEIYQQNMKQRLEVNLKKCDFVAGRLIDEYLYGKEHPYGKYTSTLDYEAVTRNALLDFYQQYYINGHCVIFVAGKLPKDIVVQLNNAFGKTKLQKANLQTNAIAASQAVEKKYRIINDANGVQGSVKLARPFPNRHHPDFQPCLVLNTLLGGFFGSRLMANIREDKGYTYGIHSYIQNHVHQCAWMVTTEAGKDVCEATISETYKEMERLRNEPIDDEELLLVKNYMLGATLGDLDGPFQIIGRWKNILLNGLDEQYFHNGINTIKTVEPAALQTLANKYLRPEDFYELVVV
jgi:zinc protease